MSSCSSGACTAEIAEILRKHGHRVYAAADEDPNPPDGSPHPNGGGWVADTAQVDAKAYIAPDAKVFGRAVVSAGARVTGRARVIGSARVLNFAEVADDAIVGGYAEVSGYARVGGRARVTGTAVVTGYARVSENARIYGRGRVCGRADVFGNARVSGTEQVSGDARVSSEPRKPERPHRVRILGLCSPEERQWHTGPLENGHLFYFTCSCGICGRPERSEEDAQAAAIVHLRAALNADQEVDLT